MVLRIKLLLRFCVEVEEKFRFLGTSDNPVTIYSDCGLLTGSRKRLRCALIHHLGSPDLAFPKPPIVSPRFLTGSFRRFVDRLRQFCPFSFLPENICADLHLCS